MCNLIYNKSTEHVSNELQLHYRFVSCNMELSNIYLNTELWDSLDFLILDWWF